MSKSFLDSLFTPEIVGTLGELYTHHELNLTRLFGRHGKNAGNSFYGCSSFPKCRYIKEIAMM